jgi:hypothetical protein
MRVNKNLIFQGGFFRWPSLIAGFFIFTFSLMAFSAEAKIVINEVMFDPDGTDGDSEWVELYNTGDEKVDLSDWDLDPDSGSYQSLSGKEIGADDHLVIDGLSKMRNSHGQVALYKSDDHTAENMVDYVQYGDWDLGATENKVRDRAFGAKLWEENDFVSGIKENYSIERKADGEDDNDKKDWQISYKKGGTPGKKNSEASDIPNIVYSKEIRINEVLPNPEGDEKEEYIEFYNSSKENIDLENWIIRDSSKSGKYEFSIGNIVPALGYFVVYKKDYKISLNNSGTETLTLYSPDEKVVSNLAYQSAKEGVSYNYSKDGWRWSKFLTPGAENIFNNLPKVAVDEPNKVYKNVYADFSAKAKDQDKDKLKYVWDFGDGHKSYLKETRHKYEKTGKFKVTLKVSDGSEDVLKEFEIEVKKMKRLDVEIIAFSANPKGKDMLGEWIEVKNSSSKKINLIKWSLATGWKNLYNHPIIEKFNLKPGESRQVSREISKFTLANTKSKLELRYPDGKAADKVEYNREGNSIEEDEIYRKIGGKWIWEKKIKAEELKKEATDLNNDQKENTEEKPPEEINPPEVQLDEPVEEQGEVLGASEQHAESIDQPSKGHWYSNVWIMINQWLNKIMNIFSFS